MGVAAAAIPYIVAAAGTAVQMYNTRQTAKKQDAALAQGIRQKAETQRRADQKIASTVDQITDSTPMNERQQTMAAYQDALRGTEQQASAGQTLSGLSQAYDEATSAGTNRANKYVQGIANALGTIDAAGLQRQREGFGTANLASDLRVLNREQEGQDFLSRLKASSIRRNPWLDAAASAAKAYGGNAGGSIDWNNLGSFGGV